MTYTLELLDVLLRHLEVILHLALSFLDVAAVFLLPLQRVLQLRGGEKTDSGERASDDDAMEDDN